MSRLTSLVLIAAAGCYVQSDDQGSIQQEELTCPAAYPVEQPGAPQQLCDVTVHGTGTPGEAGPGIVQVSAPVPWSQQSPSVWLISCYDTVTCSFNVTVNTPNCSPGVVLSAPSCPTPDSFARQFYVGSTTITSATKPTQTDANAACATAFPAPSAWDACNTYASLYNQPKTPMCCYAQPSSGSGSGSGH